MLGWVARSAGERRTPSQGDCDLEIDRRLKYHGLLMSTAQVTVIIPTYNRAYSLRAAIGSVQRQTMPAGRCWL
jgi:hypothetical protein